MGAGHFETAAIGLFSWFRKSARSTLTASTVIATLAVFALAGVPQPGFAQEESGGDSGITLLRDAEIETFLHKITLPVFDVALPDPGAVHIYLVGSDEINAFVAGGQNVFVFSGLIEDMRTPNELAGVLAHETGHMADGHLTRSPNGSVSVPMILGMVMGVGAMAAGSPNAGEAILAGSETVAQANQLAFTRVQEASADQAAARFLNASGQSGKGILAVFERFANEEAMSMRAPNPFAVDHPVSSARIAALQTEVESSKYYNKTDPPAEVAAFDLVKAKLHGFLDPGDVVLRRYPLSDKSAPARYARSVFYFRDGELDKSLDEINSLIAEQPKNPYFEELKGQILYESGRAVDSVAPYAAAVKLAPDQPLIRTGYGQALFGASEAKHDPSLVEQAATELRASVAVEPDLSDAWTTLAQAYAAQDKIGLAELATAEMYFNAGGIGPAVEFATRARSKLTKGTVPYNRATDIIQVARAQGGSERD
jgi:predicted Zn-dependent protease